jgi:hypothetical protein
VSKFTYIYSAVPGGKALAGDDSSLRVALLNYSMTRNKPVELLPRIILHAIDGGLGVRDRKIGVRRWDGH